MDSILAAEDHQGGYGMGGCLFLLDFPVGSQDTDGEGSVRLGEGGENKEMRKETQRQHLLLREAYV